MELDLCSIKPFSLFMKTHVTKTTFIMGNLIALVFGIGNSHAQGQKDEAAINAQIDTYLSDCVTHHFTKNMKTYTTKDAEWINIVGMNWRGQEEMVQGHQRIFDAIFNNVPFTKKSTRVRFVTSDVAVVTLRIHVGAFFPPDGVDRGVNKRPETDDLLTLVFVKKNESWLLTAGQNTVVDENAKNPVETK